MSNKDKRTIGFLIISFILVSIGWFCWSKNPDNVLAIASIYFGGQFTGIAKERINNE